MWNWQKTKSLSAQQCEKLLTGVQASCPAFLKACCSEPTFSEAGEGQECAGSLHRRACISFLVSVCSNALAGHILSACASHACLRKHRWWWCALFSWLRSGNKKQEPLLCDRQEARSVLACLGWGAFWIADGENAGQRARACDKRCSSASVSSSSSFVSSKVKLTSPEHGDNPQDSISECESR